MLNLSVLLALLSTVESNNNRYAVNQSEGAYGILQIRQCVLDDVNSYYGKSFTLEDCFSPTVSRWVCLRYLERWDALGSYEEAARTWNGGPRGPTKKSTEKYWKKVKSLL